MPSCFNQRIANRSSQLRPAERTRCREPIPRDSSIGDLMTPKPVRRARTCVDNWQLVLREVRDTFTDTPQHQKIGFFRGVPTDLGYIAGVGLTLIRTWNAAPCRTRPRSSSPNSARPFGSQRSVTASSGGSETIITPPRFKKRAPHSAVTEGGPNDRAVTKSKLSSISGNLAISSILPIMTSPLGGAPSQSSTSCRK